MLVALEDSREIAGDVAFEAAADRSKRCFAVQPVGVVARGDQQRGRGLGAKTLLVEQLGWCGELHEHRELSVELGAFGIEGLEPSSKGPQCDLGGGERIRDSAVGPEPRRPFDNLAEPEVA